MKKLTLTIMMLLIASLAFAQSDPAQTAQGRMFYKQQRFAQDGICPAGFDGPRMDGPGGPGGFDGRAREHMEAFRLYKLTEYLELTEDQTAKLFPRMAEINKLRETFRFEAQEKMNELEELIENDKIRQAAKLANEMQDARWEHELKMHALNEEIFELFTDAQQARFVLFQKKFRGHLKRVEEKMHQRRMDRPGGPDSRRGRRGPQGG